MGFASQRRCPRGGRGVNGISIAGRDVFRLCRRTQRGTAVATVTMASCPRLASPVGAGRASYLRYLLIQRCLVTCTVLFTSLASFLFVFSSFFYCVPFTPNNFECFPSISFHFFPFRSVVSLVVSFSNFSFLFHCFMSPFRFPSFFVSIRDSPFLPILRLFFPFCVNFSCFVPFLCHFFLFSLLFHFSFLPSFSPWCSFFHFIASHSTLDQSVWQRATLKYPSEWVF